MTSRSPAGRDRWSAVGLAILALAYLLAARRYPLDTLATPGPGVVPLVAGCVLIALSVWQFLTAGPATEAGPRPERAPLVLSVVLAAYAAVLPVLGFVPASAALVFVTARAMGLPGWWRPAALALGVTGICRVLFGTWLGVPLP
jgi:hypothetical protein